MDRDFGTHPGALGLLTALCLRPTLPKSAAAESLLLLPDAWSPACCQALLRLQEVHEQWGLQALALEVGRVLPVLITPSARRDPFPATHLLISITTLVLEHWIACLNPPILHLNKPMSSHTPQPKLHLPPSASLNKPKVLVQL